MSSKNSQCETFVPMLDAFVDNELDGSEREQVLMHVQSCDDCKRHVKEIEALKTSLSALPRRKMTIDLADNFDQILTKESETTQAKPSNVVPLNGKRRWIVGVASAAAVVVIAIAGSIVSKGGGEQVANSNLPGGLQSVAQTPDQKNNSAKKGMKTEEKNAVADNQLPKIDSSDDNVKGAQGQDSLAVNSHSGEKIAAKEHESAGAGTNSVGVSGKTASAHLNEDATQDQSSNTAVVAHDENSKTGMQGMQKSRPASSELLALYEEDDGIGSDIGMTTDEDGLYAIKL